MKKTFSKITLDGIVDGLKVDKGILQAQVRQTVITEYPSARVTNSGTIGLFNEEEFDLPEGQTYESIRVAWFSVPAGTTAEEVQARLDKHSNARIYAVYSNNLQDVLTDEQKAALSSGVVTEETLYNRHVVRDNNQQIVTPIQFKANFFSAVGADDIDFRTEVKATATANQATQKVEMMGGVGA